MLFRRRVFVSAARSSLCGGSRCGAASTRSSGASASSPHPQTLPKPKLTMLVDVVRRAPHITTSAAVPFGGSALASRARVPGRSHDDLTPAERAASFRPTEKSNPGTGQVGHIATFDGWNVLRSAYLAHYRAAGDGGGARLSADTAVEKRYADYLYYDADIVVVPDAYPKSTFHFLVLPMPTASSTGMIRAVADLRPTREHIRLLQKMAAVADALTNAISGLALPSHITTAVPAVSTTTENGDSHQNGHSNTSPVQRIGDLADFVRRTKSTASGSSAGGVNASLRDQLARLQRSGPEFMQPSWMSSATPDVLARSQFHLFSRRFSHDAAPEVKACALWGLDDDATAPDAASVDASRSLSFREWWRRPRSRFSPTGDAKGASPNRCRFMWGFHALPSLEPLHMHVISLDLASDRLKNSKHYNSFTTPFFLLQSQVEAHLSATTAGGGRTGDAALAAATTSVSWAQRLEKDLPRLKALEMQPMVCVWCGAAAPSVAELRKHLLVCGKNASQIPPV